MAGLKGKKVVYGFNDAENSIVCTVTDMKFLGIEILLVAECSGGGMITAPIEMFKQI